MRIQIDLDCEQNPNTHGIQIEYDGATKEGCVLLTAICWEGKDEEERRDIEIVVCLEDLKKAIAGL